MTMEKTLMMLKTVELGKTEGAEYSLIWLHGLGADGNDFVPLIPELNLPFEDKMHCVFPHAPVRPVALHGGMPLRAWFDLETLDENGFFDEEGIREAVASVHRLIDQEVARGIPAAKIILAGFSQGGYVALLSGMLYPQALGGLVGLSTFLWPTSDFESRRHPSNQNTPIFLVHGDRDPLVPLSYGEKTAAMLKNKGYDLSFHTYPMGHTLCPDEVKALSLWLQERFI